MDTQVFVKSRQGLEVPRLVTGQVNYIDDTCMLHLVLVRQRRDSV
jgi:hypothetical protein